MTDEELMMLAEVARQAREGRDAWREVGPILAQLRAGGWSLRQIQRATGISPATTSRIAPIPTRTGGNGRSTTAR